MTDIHQRRLSLGHVEHYYLKPDICFVKTCPWCLTFNTLCKLQVLLGLVLDIKNNRQRSQGTGGPLTITAVLSAGVLKWLRTSGIDEVQLRNLSWQQVLQPTKKVSCPMPRVYQKGAQSVSATPSTCGAGRCM